MSKICQITGKRAMEQDCWVSLNISAAGLRTINKLGLDAAIKMAAEKGYLNA